MSALFFLAGLLGGVVFSLSTLYSSDSRVGEAFRDLTEQLRAQDTCRRELIAEKANADAWDEAFQRSKVIIVKLRSNVPLTPDEEKSVEDYCLASQFLADLDADAEGEPV